MFIIIFVSTRGAFIFFFKFPSNILYPLTTLLILFFGIYASIKIYYENFNYGVNSLKKLIYINILLLSIFFLIKIISPNLTSTSSGKLLTSDITTFLIFPIALLISKWSPKLIIISLFCILITQMIGILIFKYYSIVDYTILYEFETKSYSKLYICITYK